MVYFAKNFQCLIFDTYHVIGGAGREHRDQTDAVDDQRNNFGGSAPTNNQQGDQSDQRKDRSCPMGQTVYWFT